MANFELPPKILNGLRRLQLHYEATRESVLLDLLSTSYSFVEVETSYDNWNSGTYGHGLVLFADEKVLRRISIDDQATICERIKDDLNRCMGTAANEFLERVEIEMSTSSDKRISKALAPNGPISADPDTLGIWKRGHLRLFVSHRDAYKREVRELADALEDYGISAFVAHESIAPMEEWQHVITSGLVTMQGMLVYLTDDFHQSTWTNQEVGFALGRNIPIITLKVGSVDPQGFIGNRQALVERDRSPEKIADRLIGVLSTQPKYAEVVRDSLITAFVESGDFGETRTRFERLRQNVKKLDQAEFERIASAYAKNTNLRNAIYLNNQYKRLATFLSGALGREVTVSDTIGVTEPSDSDAIPF